MGYVTNGIAALKLNSKFVGIEIDPIYFSDAQAKLSSIKIAVLAISEHEKHEIAFEV
jgi:DNA modification methylase